MGNLEELIDHYREQCDVSDLPDWVVLDFVNRMLMEFFIIQEKIQKLQKDKGAE